MKTLSLQLASEQDLPLIMQFINEAKQHLKDQGIDQWQDGYPNCESIQADITAQKGFVAVYTPEETSTPQKIGYLCIDFEGEPAYNTIVGGQWHASAPYAVVHRFTIGDAFKGKKLANQIFALVDDYCAAHSMPNFRIDTSPANLKMQHVLLNHGFAFCGTVFYTSGERFAYDKHIPISFNQSNRKC